MAGGGRECVAKIRIFLRREHKYFVAAPALAALLGIAEDTHARFMQALWSYCRARGLVCADDPGAVSLDAQLRALLSVAGAPTSHPELCKGRAAFATVCAYAADLLSEAPPVSIEHRLATGKQQQRGAKASNGGVGGASPESCYDIEVELAAPSVRDADSDAVAQACDDELRALCGRIEGAAARAAFFRAFEASPVDFINATVLSQGRDLQVAAASDARARSASSTDGFAQPWAARAADVYLKRR